MARYFNIPFYTLGGINLWQDVAVSSGWKVQKSLLFNSYRLIDNHNIRRQRGEKKFCLAALQKYICDWEIDDEAEEVTLILGGLMRTRLCFDSVAEEVSTRKNPCFYVNYSPTLTGIRDCSLSLVSILSNLSDSVKKVNFVTFGIGGLILRQALAYQSDWQNKIRIGKVLMIAVPNQGSAKAEKLKEKIWFRFIAGKALRPLLPKEAKKIPPLPKDIDAAVIAGNHFNKNSDGFLTVSETVTEGVAEKLTVNYTHIGIMNADRITSLIHNYLKYGTLSRIRPAFTSATSESLAAFPASAAFIARQPIVSRGRFANVKSKQESALNTFAKKVFNNKNFMAFVKATGKVIAKCFKVLKNVVVFIAAQLAEIIKTLYSLSKAAFKKIAAAYRHHRELVRQAQEKRNEKARIAAEIAAKNKEKAEAIAKIRQEQEKAKADILAKTSEVKPEIKEAVVAFKPDVIAKRPVEVKVKDKDDEGGKLISALSKHFIHSSAKKKSLAQDKAWKEEQIQVLTSSNGVSSYFSPFSGFLKN